MAESALKQRITDDMKSAMRAQDKAKLSAIRLITAAIKQVEVDERIELDEARVLGILETMKKQRRDALQQYQDAGREDLAQQEQYEIDLIQSYLPEPLSAAELTAAIEAAISETSAESMRDMGNVMAILKPQIQGRADMSEVSRLVKEKLS